MKIYQSKEMQKKRFLKILKKKKIYTQNQFVEEYEKYYGVIAQPTVSSYFKEFNIIKDDNGVYYQDDSDEISDLISETCYYVGRIHNDFFQAIIKCNIGCERDVCEAITEKFHAKASAVIPAYGSVVLMCKEKKSARTILSYVNRYRARRNDEEE